MRVCVVDTLVIIDPLPSKTETPNRAAVCESHLTLSTKQMALLYYALFIHEDLSYPVDFLCFFEYACSFPLACLYQ